ncbi:exosortase/archaeosortase family protein [Sphingomonas sp. H39-1-10]|uniref:exosortase/archaeosortase family protein n=1 Tax=Sphingomonas pollutisoli TaxID=3030829 RepID=UPI0023B99971|nr:exosortase/archaeosortase family protein [Sphingomonas pollutisoli]MDF0486570.1 exosortase/archaeosortase family protein [Sphingomonas pollutisoli]
MTAATATPGPAHVRERAAGAPVHRTEGVALALILFGLVALYVPVLVEYGALLLWSEEDNHSGLLLALVLFAYWRDRRAFTWSATRRERVVGASGVFVALILYFIGRVTDSVQLQGVSLPIVMTSLALATGGTALARRWLLLAALLIFIVPWFGPIADALLVPLRLALTHSAARLAAALGFPVTTSGVLIYVGFVRLNVAGACVGLRAMVSMTAIGFLFLHFFPARSRGAALLFVVLMPVIALSANFIRIFALIVTAALFGVSGEAIVHDVAAYVEVGVVLTAFMLLGRALGPVEARA